MVSGHGDLGRPPDHPLALHLREVGGIGNEVAGEGRERFGGSDHFRCDLAAEKTERMVE